MDRDLFLSVLSLDSYHRGYGPGLYFDRLGVSGSNIGLAQLDDAKGDLAAQSIGFFAQSYLWNGEKVISFRGTDSDLSLLSGSWWSSTDDQWNGWGIGAGSPDGPQAEMAIEFYKTVSGVSGAALENSGVVLTGQSLGGRLAGLVGSLYSLETVVFNHMPFLAAADNAHASATTGGDTDLLNLIYDGASTTWEDDPTEVRAYSVEAEILGLLTAAGSGLDPRLPAPINDFLVHAGQANIDSVARHYQTSLAMPVWRPRNGVYAAWCVCSIMANA